MNWYTPHIVTENLLIKMDRKYICLKLKLIKIFIIILYTKNVHKFNFPVSENYLFFIIIFFKFSKHYKK